MKDTSKAILALFLLSTLAGCSSEQMSGFTDFNNPGNMAASFAAACATITLVLYLLGDTKLHIAFGYGLGIPSVLMLVVSPFIYLKTHDAGTGIAIGLVGVMGSAIGAALAFIRRKN